MTETRSAIAARERGPGPGRYFLPSTMGFQAHDVSKKMEPAYSFGRRVHCKSSKSEDSPGPCYFVSPYITRFGRDGTPSYSLLSRQEEPRQFKTPAPGTYFPEYVHPQGEKIAPRYSLGFRTRFRHKDQNPSPNNYALPGVMGPTQPNKTSAAAYSITGRPTVGSYLEDLAKTPGPGQAMKIHPDVYMMKAPHYSLGSRNYMPGDNVKKPGPGTHHPERVKINKLAAPKHSLGIRHSEFVCPLIP